MTTAAVEQQRPEIAGFLANMRRELGDAAVSQRALHLIAYARDLWPRGTIAIRDGVIEHRPSAVVWPRNEAEVGRVLSLASDAGVPVVPYGAGSGVCGGTLPLDGAVVVDLKRLDRVLAIDRSDWTATVDAGVMGQLLEDELNRNGMTLGHFPSSIYCSTVGGWIATRSGGQCSSKYGKIEDLVTGLRVAAPGGVFAIGDIDGAGARRLDPGWLNAIVGSEGVLGAITRATLRLHPLPTARAFRAFDFATVALGVDAMRVIMQGGFRPAVVRLYDEFDTWINRAPKGHPATRGSGETTAASEPAGMIGEALKRVARKLGAQAARIGLRAPGLLNRVAGFSPQHCLLVTVFEGDGDAAEREEEAARAAIVGAGGKDLGEGPARSWFERRYHISYKLSAFFEAGLFVETLEFAAPWSRFVALVDAVRRALGETVFVMAHMSHAYVDGCSVYFTFAGVGRDLAESRAKYDRTIAAALSAARSVGGSFTHHHGVGLSKAAHMAPELGPLMNVFRALKGEFDPKRVMNRGKVGL